LRDFVQVSQALGDRQSQASQQDLLRGIRGRHDRETSRRSAICAEAICRSIGRDAAAGVTDACDVVTRAARELPVAGAACQRIQATIDDLFQPRKRSGA